LRDTFPSWWKGKKSIYARPARLPNPALLLIHFKRLIKFFKILQVQKIPLFSQGVRRRYVPRKVILFYCQIVNVSNFSFPMIDQLSQITPHLFLSNWSSSENMELLKSYNIRAILTAETHFREQKVLDEYKNLGISYKQIFVEDSTMENISLYFNPSYDFIEEHVSKGQNVLVNCYAGVSRSATLVLNWIIRNWYKSCPPFGPHEAVSNAIEFLRKKRPIINPNSGFVKQLIAAAEVYKESCQQHLKEKMNTPNSPSHSMNPITARANPMPNLPGNGGNGGNSGQAGQMGQMAQAGQMMGSASPTPRMGSNIQDVVSGSRPADPNIIFLTNQDFDGQGNLTNFSDINAVVWFFSHGCGHCQHMKSEYEKFAMLLANSPAIRALAVDTAKHRDLMARIKPEVFGFSVMGVPMVVSYNKGKFYSEYADDDRTKFRTADSLLQYAAGIGNAPVEAAPVR
jgi:protein-tyrosine phosphatase